MIRHVVMWKFKPDTRKEMEEFLAGLQGLYGVIPQIRAQQVGVNCVEGNYDAVLISDFDSLADLETYKKDPRHVAVSALCKAIRTDRVAVDYELRPYRPGGPTGGCLPAGQPCHYRRPAGQRLPG